MLAADDDRGSRDANVTKNEKKVIILKVNNQGELSLT